MGKQDFVKNRLEYIDLAKGIMILLVVAEIVLIYVCKQIPMVTGFARKLSFIGKNTLAIYLIHTFFVFTGENKNIDISGFHRLAPILLLTLFISFAIALICIGIAQIIAYFPALNYLLFGRKTKL